MTVNHGVLGSSPRGGANEATYEIKLVSGFFVCAQFAHKILGYSLHRQLSTKGRYAAGLLFRIISCSSVICLNLRFNLDLNFKPLNMKRLLFVLLAILFTEFTFGQTATNFTANDCAGNPHNLFNELDAGKV